MAQPFSSNAILDEISAAASAVASALGPDGARAPLAVVAGSGLGGLTDLGRVAASIDYSAIPALGSANVAGHAGRWTLLETPSGPVHCLLGRRHLYEGIEPRVAGLLMRVAARIGIRDVLLTNAAGGLAGRLVPGDLMLIDDHINLAMRNPLLGAHDARLGPRFVDLSEPYDRAMQAALLEIALRSGIALKRGTYLALSGPSYETPAEVRAFRRLGADAVGMSTVPETLAARQAGLRVAAISMITNSHVEQGPTTHEEVLSRGREGASRLLRLVAGLIAASA